MASTSPAASSTIPATGSGVSSISGNQPILPTAAAPSISTSVGVPSPADSSTTALLPTSELQPVASDAASPSDNSSMNRTTLIGIIAGGAALALIVLLFALVVILRRRRRRRAQSESSGSSEENQIAQRRPSIVTRGPSREQAPRRSAGEAGGPMYEAVSSVGFGTANSALLPTTPFLSDKEPSSEATTPNIRHSTLENETQEGGGEVKNSTILDPFSSGYIPPPSPTPSEYVIVEHTADQPPAAPRTSRDNRESRTSLLDTIVPEEGTKEFSTIGSTVSGRTSGLGHRRMRSGDGAAAGGPGPSSSVKRTSNRLHKPRPSVESTSSLFLRSTSPTYMRSPTPIAFPRDPFEASMEEEEGVGPLRQSLERPQRTSAAYEMQDLDGQSSQRPSVSAKPSLDTVGGGSRKKSHIRTPSSPSRLLPTSPGFLGVGKRAASSSALSLQHLHEYEPSNNGPYMNSATMADASVYDFDIYRQDQTPPPPPLPTGDSTNSRSHPPPASSARLSAAINADLYGASAGKKRFSASMSDLPDMSPAPFSSHPDRLYASMSTSNLHAQGAEAPVERRGLEPTTNLYIPKESLDLNYP